MKNENRALLLGLALLMFLAPAPAAFAQQDEPRLHITQVDDSGFPRVVVYVSVTDAAGEPVGVEPGRIRLFEDGQLMQPEEVSGSGEIGSLTTLLVVDVSGSMRYEGKLAAAQAAARTYVEQMRPGDQAGLVAFNHEVDYRQALTSDRQALIRAIDGLRAEGDTALFEALGRAVQILEGIAGRKAVIALTDGLDNRSRLTAVDILQAVSDGGLSLSTIGLGDPSNPGAVSGLDEAALRSLAESAGGYYGYANDAEALRSLYEYYGRVLQSEYRLTYVSPSPLRDGLNRHLTVSLTDGAAASDPARYNPGGVLPEVAGAASWPVFLVLLAALVGLLFVPGLLGRLQGGLPRKRKPRIKLK